MTGAMRKKRLIGNHISKCTTYIFDKRCRSHHGVAMHGNVRLSDSSECNAERVEHLKKSLEMIENLIRVL